MGHFCRRSLLVKMKAFILISLAVTCRAIPAPLDRGWNAHGTIEFDITTEYYGPNGARDEPSSWDSYISSSGNETFGWDRDESSSGDEPSSWDSYISSSGDEPSAWDRYMSSSGDEPSSWASYISSSGDETFGWDRDESSSGDEPSSWDESSSGSF